MRVAVRLFAGLRERLPREARGRTCVELPVGAALSDLLARLGIEPVQAQMVLVNGEQVPRRPGVRSAWRLADGDTVAVFPPVAGG